MTTRRIAPSGVASSQKAAPHSASNASPETVGFIRAALSNNVELVRHYLQRQPSLIHYRHSGASMLSWVARQGHEETLGVLIPLSAVTPEWEQVRAAAMEHAAIEGYPGVLQALLDAPGVPKKAASAGALNRAAYGGHGACARILLKHIGHHHGRDLSVLQSKAFAQALKGEHWALADRLVASVQEARLLHQTASQGSVLVRTQAVLEHHELVVSVQSPQNATGRSATPASSTQATQIGQKIAPFDTPSRRGAPEASGQEKAAKDVTPGVPGPWTSVPASTSAVPAAPAVAAMAGEPDAGAQRPLARGPRKGRRL